MQINKNSIKNKKIKIKPVGMKQKLKNKKKVCLPANI